MRIMKRLLSKLPHAVWALTLCGLLLLPVSAQAAPKTDVLSLINGDVITCEIKDLAYGKLLVKTDDIGTLTVKWDKVVRLTSRDRFLIRLGNGSLVYGRLPDSGEDKFLAVAPEYGTEDVRLAMDKVVGLEPVRYNLWDRIDLAISAGFNWTKASDTSQGNLAASAKYKGRVYRYGFGAKTMVTTERDNRTTRRNDLDLHLNRQVSGRLQAGVTGGLQRNDELGLARRTSAGLNMSYLMFMSRHFEVAIQGGATGNREQSTLDAPSRNSAEALFSATLTFFRYDSPKTDVTARADTYPSLSIDERVRFEFDLALRHELATDLFVELKYYESRDNRPPAGAESTSDRGVVFSLGWTK